MSSHKGDFSATDYEFQISRDISTFLWHNGGMRFLTLLAWCSYFFVIVSFAYINAFEFFSPSQPKHLYFFILFAFNASFYISYALESFQIFFNILSCFCLALYIFRIRLFTPTFWQHVFILRCIFDLIGHSYEMNYFLAYYNTSILFFWILIGTAILTYIPSYFACFEYAFGNRVLFDSAKKIKKS